MRQIVMFSGGLGSWAAAKRVIAEHGSENVVLLFADTLIEDEDLYRFLDDASANLGVPITRIVDGRNPWEVFWDERFIGNSRKDPCSKILKRELLDRWRNDNCDPADTTISVGLSWWESHRVQRLLARTGPTGWTYSAPMAVGDLLDPEEVKAWAQREGLKTPRLYEMGFPHNNCGGFCVKAGHAQFARLLRHFPDRYAAHELQEWMLQNHLGPSKKTGLLPAIMTDRRGKKRVPMSLRTFRIRLEQDPNNYDHNDEGGCGCALATE